MAAPNPKTDLMRFDGRVAIVTGAGGGLGRAYAELLAARGARVLVNDLGGDFRGAGADAGYAEQAARSIQECGGIAAANTDSVASSAGADSIVADALRRWGRIDILINNAGIVGASPPLDNVSDEQWTHDLAVAAGGTFYLSRAVWPHMKAQNYGRILNVGSGAWFGMSSALPYPAAKGAVWAMTRALAAVARAQQLDLRINAIMPIAASRMSVLMGEKIEAIMRRDFPPSAVAPVAALLTHESAPCSGEMFSVGGGGFARVFAAVSEGYRGTDKQWTPEDARAHFHEAMRIDAFAIPADAMDEASMYVSGVPWDSFRTWFR